MRTHKIKLIFLFAIIGVGLTTYLYLKKTTTSSIISELKSKKNIYGFKSEAFTKSAEYFIINYWATWCPPCIAETPSLIRFVKSKNGKYHLFALSQDSSTKEIENFLKTFPDFKNIYSDIIWDDNKALARKLNVEKLPETFIYSLKKEKFLKISGSADWDSKEIENFINDYFSK